VLIGGYRQISLSERLRHVLLSIPVSGVDTRKGWPRYRTIVPAKTGLLSPSDDNVGLYIRACLVYCKTIREVHENDRHSSPSKAKEAHRTTKPTVGATGNTRMKPPPRM